MFRMTKLTDYGIVLLTHFAQKPFPEPQTARELAAATRLPLPTVGKLLKQLVRGGLLLSHRGTNGGYSLACRPEEVPVADIIAALEGPIAITECNTVEADCEHANGCAVRPHWQVINHAVREALSNVTLADMARRESPRLFDFARPGRTGELPVHVLTRSIP